MNENQEKLVEAAAVLFARHGVKRTSMAAVAQQASLSRQTLYSLFPGKDELLAAAMNHVVDQILSSLADEWVSCSSVEEILNAYYKHAVYGPFQMLQKSPDLKDLLHGVGEHTEAVAVDVEKRQIKQLAEKLAPFQSQLAIHGSDPKAIAHLIVKTTCELKYSINKRRELEKLLQTLSQLVMAMM